MDLDEDDNYEIPTRSWFSRMSLLAVVAIIAAAIPLGAHFTVGGQDYVQLAGGTTAILFGALAFAWEIVRALRKKPFRGLMGGLVPLAMVGVGVGHVFLSGFGPEVFFSPDREAEVRALLESRGMERVEITGRSDDGLGYEFEARQHDGRCIGSVRFASAFDADNLAEFVSCGLDLPFEELEEGCEGGDGQACARAAEQLRDQEPTDAPRMTELAARACELGEERECFYLGVALYFGDRGLEQDDSAAVANYVRSCEAGDRVGCTNAGTMLRTGRGIEADLPRAASLYERACDDDYLRACGELGGLFAQGRGVEQDYDRARELLARACDGEVAIACGNLALQYERGNGVEASRETALSLYERGCRLGRPQECGYAAHLQARGVGGDEMREPGVERLEAVCREGPHTFCSYSGLLLHEGDGPIAQDRARALTIFQVGCDGGDAVSCRNIGIYHREGFGGLTADRDAARPFFQRACDGGDQPACRELGG